MPRLDAMVAVFDNVCFLPAPSDINIGAFSEIEGSYATLGAGIAPPVVLDTFEAPPARPWSYGYGHA